MNQGCSLAIRLALLELLVVWGLPGGQLSAQEANPGAVGRLKYEEPKSLKASIYAADGRQLLFNFTRIAIRSNSTLRVQRDFKYPDGRLAAQERVVYEGNELVSSELEETQIGAAGSAEIRRAANKPGSIEFKYQAPGGQPKARTETLRKDTLMADMVGPFLADHWPELSRGESVTCRYLVVHRRETVGFTFVKTAEGSWQDQPVTIVRMEPTSRLLAALIEPLFFTIENSPLHRVLRYTGRTAPKIRVGNKWKNLEAVTVFDWQ